jgi:transposase InsO family protein
VRKEVIRLKALMLRNGCRKIAATFNHLHRERHGMTVGKSFVAQVIRSSQLEIVRRRRELKHRMPRRLAKNLVWAADLTQVGDERGGQRAILGLLDLGTRASLALRDMRTKSSIALLRELLDAIERYGTPRSLRTDNEACFTSRLFRFALLLLGIRHRPIAPFAPWQNGRIERFFRTFKEVRWEAERSVHAEPLQSQLDVVRFWYNHVRPHEHLGGRTPAMAWAGQERPKGRARFVSAWDHWLAGYYFPT